MEIIQLAFNAIRGNKLRSVLTLLGIVIGVFSIIGVMTAVDVLQNSIEEGFSSLGSNTFQIQKRPVMATRAERIASRNRKVSSPSRPSSRSRPQVTIRTSFADEPRTSS